MDPKMQNEWTNAFTDRVRSRIEEVQPKNFEQLISTIAAAAAFFPFPEGSVVVDRARFERLREFAVASEEYRIANLPGEDDGAYLDALPIVKRVVAARHALQPGDLDPLP